MALGRSRDMSAAQSLSEDKRTQLGHRRSEAFDPQRPFATANYRIAKEIYSIASSAGASIAGGLDNCRA